MDTRFIGELVLEIGTSLSFLVSIMASSSSYGVIISLPIYHIVWSPSGYQPNRYIINESSVKPSFILLDGFVTLNVKYVKCKSIPVLLLC